MRSGGTESAVGNAAKCIGMLHQKATARAESKMAAPSDGHLALPSEF